MRKRSGVTDFLRAGRRGSNIGGKLHNGGGLLIQGDRTEALELALDLRGLDIGMGNGQGCEHRYEQDDIARSHGYSAFIKVLLWGFEAARNYTPDAVTAAMPGDSFKTRHIDYGPDLARPGVPQAG